MSCPVTLSENDGWATISLNRPDARNALNAETWIALDDALDRIEDVNYPALLLTGSGRYFSAGGDMKTAPAHGGKAIAPAGRLELAYRVIDRLRAMTIPTAAAVEGGAAGLGWGLALACDIVITAEDARFSAPFVKRGVPPDGAVLWHLVQHAGRLRMADIILSGRPVDATEAHALGLVSRIVASGTACDAATAMLNDLVRTPHAVELTKRLTAVAETSAFAAYAQAEMLAAALGQTGDEAAQARLAYLEERKS